MFTIMRRNERLPETQAITELRRAPHIHAARRIAHEVAYRFFEATGQLNSRAACSTCCDILAWTGELPIDVTIDGQRLLVAAQ